MNELYLQVHPINNIVGPAHKGLHFLGHIIHANSVVVVEAAMAKKLQNNLQPNNAASYRAMHLSNKQQKQFPWLLLEP